MGEFSKFDAIGSESCSILRIMKQCLMVAFGFSRLPVMVPIECPYGKMLCLKEAEVHMSCGLLSFAPPKKGVWSIVINWSLYVCLPVCLTAGPIGTKLRVRIFCGYGSVLLRRHCATLCTSSFMDDITFSRNGHDAETWRLHYAAAMAMSCDAVWRYRGGV